LGKGQDLVVKHGGGESQRLANIFVFEFGVLTLELGAVGIESEGLEDAADGETKVADARLAIHASHVHFDAIKFLHGGENSLRAVSVRIPDVGVASMRKARKGVVWDIGDTRDIRNVS
jgi:hypothetical protein